MQNTAHLAGRRKKKLCTPCGAACRPRPHDRPLCGAGINVLPLTRFYLADYLPHPLPPYPRIQCCRRRVTPRGTEEKIGQVRRPHSRHQATLNAGVGGRGWAMGEAHTVTRRMVIGRLTADTPAAVLICKDSYCTIFSSFNRPPKSGTGCYHEGGWVGEGEGR